MIRRIIAIGFIFGCISAGWFVLGDVTDRRSYAQDEKLSRDVGRLWGSLQQQRAPVVRYRTWEHREVTRTVGQATFTETEKVPVWHQVPLDASRIEVDLSLEHRKRGLIWYPTYRVGFIGVYTIVNRAPDERELHFGLDLPDQAAVYDDFRFMVNDRVQEDVELHAGSFSRVLRLAPEASARVAVSYRTQGLDAWLYQFGEDVSRVRDFELVMRTDFTGIDFPVPSMSPTTKQRHDSGWELTWRYASLLSGVQIGMLMPKKLNPGPWVSRITFFAPVSLFFFFFLLFIFTTVREVRIHPMNYFFLGAAFFSFHLLLAYLVDHISIHTAFVICSVVSVLLTVSYMRLVTGVRFALVEVGVSQFVYLVGFSYTFFFEGATGLSVTIMCILTLFVVMQYTGRLDWERVFREASDRLEQAASGTGSR